MSQSRVLTGALFGNFGGSNYSAARTVRYRSQKIIRVHCIKKEVLEVVVLILLWATEGSRELIEGLMRK